MHRSLVDVPLLWHLHRTNVVLEKELEDIERHCQSEGGACRPSRLFNGVSSIISPTRRSQQYELATADVFDLGERIMRSVCPEAFVFLRLVRGHVDVIQSSTGDFFESHTDFPLVARPGGHVSLTLLVCLHPAESGGGLLLYAGMPQETRVCYTRGSATLFPCAVPHAGTKVTAGQKTLLKYDVISSEPLWKVEMEQSGSCEYAEKLLPLKTLKRFDSLIAKIWFDGDLGSTRTSLLNLQEFSLMLNFFNGFIEVENLPRIQGLLDRLCCLESGLPSSALLQLSVESLAVLPRDVDVSPFLTHKDTYLVLFVVCCHRSRRLHVAEFTDPKEKLQSYCVVLPSIVAMFVRFCWREDKRVLFHKRGEEFSVEEADRTVFDDAINIIEMYDETIVSIDVFETARDDFEDSGWSSEMPTLEMTRAEVLEMSEKAVRAMCNLQPTRHIVSAQSEIDECNDGSTYSTVRYETSIIRSNYVLLRK